MEKIKIFILCKDIIFKILFLLTKSNDIANSDEKMKASNFPSKNDWIIFDSSSLNNEIPYNINLEYIMSLVRSNMNNKNKQKISELMCIFEVIFFF